MSALVDAAVTAHVKTRPRDGLVALVIEVDVKRFELRKLAAQSSARP
jgi:hypothetical protein